MIDIKALNNRDYGAWVNYNNGFDNELGRIKSWNDKYIFVVYYITSAAFAYLHSLTPGY